MFVLALVHAAFVIIQYHAFGDANPLVSVFTAYQQDYDPFVRQTANISHFPFEPLGAAALVILFLMASTSHDFWLANLGASWWKRLHLLVLVAYGLIVLHVTYGVLQSEPHPLYVVLLGIGVVGVYGLHLAAGWKERSADRAAVGPESEGYVRACAVGELEEGRGHSVWLGSERVAVFRHEGKVFATSNVCRHQGGPLGEGRIIDGCITCPWHGWQYRPADGTSPPPFDERVETYRVRVQDDEVWIHPTPDPAGNEQPGAPIGGNNNA
jgi:nitrite reductase/ring-hydroxylating ferredoxin subunit